MKYVKISDFTFSDKIRFIRSIMIIFIHQIHYDGDDDNV